MAAWGGVATIGLEAGLLPDGFSTATTLVGSVLMLSWTILPPDCSSFPVTRFLPEASSGFLLLGNLDKILLETRINKLFNQEQKSLIP